MAAEHRKATHRDATGDQMVVGVAHTRRLHLDLHLVPLRVADLDLVDRPWLVELPEESAFCLHRVLLSLENCSDRVSYPGHTWVLWVTRSVRALSPAGSSPAPFRRTCRARCVSACL